MRVSTSEDGQTFLPPKVLLTPQSFDAGMSLLLDTISDLTKGQAIEGIAGGVAGPLDTSQSFLLNAPNLPDWINRPIKQLLSDRFQTQVFLENDAALAGLGEATFGAGRGYPIVVYLTLSTGVGGTRITNGQIDQHALGFEPGHQVLDPSGPICPGCKRKGHLEAFIGGTSLTKRFGRKPEEITDQKVWDDVAYYLALGLNNVLVFWSPHIIVLGGPITSKLDVAKVRAYVKEWCQIFPTQPPIVTSSLSENALYGALSLFKS